MGKPTDNQTSTKVKELIEKSASDKNENVKESAKEKQRYINRQVNK